MKISKLKLLALAATVALAGCATASAPSKPVKKGPYIGVDARLASRASAFEAFTRKAGAIDPSFSGPGEIGERLRTAAGYEPKELEAGMVAYAALAAMQEPAFVAGVRARGRAVSGQLPGDPAAALALPGAYAASQRANAALARRGEVLADAGARVKAASYSVQRQTWSRARLTNGPQRLSAVKSAAGYRPESADRAKLTSALAEGGRKGGASPVVTRGVALAALTLLGQEGSGRSLLSEPRSGQCLRLAKLNYHQCLAAAGTHYEDIYCLGVHAMRDPGQCVVDATRTPAPTRRARL